MNDLPYSFVFGVPFILFIFVIAGYFIFSHMSKKLDEEFPDNPE